MIRRAIIIFASSQNKNRIGFGGTVTLALRWQLNWEYLLLLSNVLLFREYEPHLGDIQFGSWYSHMIRDFPYGSRPMTRLGLSHDSLPAQRICKAIFPVAPFLLWHRVVRCFFGFEARFLPNKTHLFRYSRCFHASPFAFPSSGCCCGQLSAGRKNAA
jgi:hypothetical protein